MPAPLLLRRMLAIVAAALIAAEPGAVMANPVNIPEPVWQAELPFSPALPDFAPGLTLAIGPGLRDRTPAAVAAIRFRMPDPVVRRYRGRLVPAITLVAVDIASGATYAAPCMGEDAPPATYDESARAESERGAPSVAGHVAVDIVELLKLPPHTARYAVFAWLDEWTSVPRGLELPAEAARAESPVRPKPNQPPTARAAGSAASSLPPDLRFVGPSAGRLRMSWNVERATPVVLLGHRLDVRTPRWEVLARADAAHATSGIAEIGMPAFLGSSQPAAAAAAFVLFAGGKATSVGPLR